MSIGRRIIGSISGLPALLVALLGTSIGMMAWLRSCHDGYVAAGEQTQETVEMGRACGRSRRRSRVHGSWLGASSTW